MLGILGEDGLPLRQMGILEQTGRQWTGAGARHGRCEVPGVREYDLDSQGRL